MLTRTYFVEKQALRMIGGDLKTSSIKIQSSSRVSLFLNCQEVDICIVHKLYQISRERNTSAVN